MGYCPRGQYPIIRLETEYDPYEKYDVGPVKTRVETFMETVKAK